MKLSQPWPQGYTVNKNSPFGWRIHPITGKKKFHHGIDVALPIGTPLTAGADGEIVHKGSGASGGYTLIIKHAPKLYVVYYHLDKPSHLPKGSRCTRGQVVASSGNTGRSTGPHLHLETRRSQTWGDTFDPMTVIGEPEIEETPAPAPEITDDPSGKIEETKPALPEPRPPMSARLARFFMIRKALR